MQIWFTCVVMIGTRELFVHFSRGIKKGGALRVCFSRELLVNRAFAKFEGEVLCSHCSNTFDLLSPDDSDNVPRLLFQSNFTLFNMFLRVDWSNREKSNVFLLSFLYTLQSVDHAKGKRTELDKKKSCLGIRNCRKTFWPFTNNLCEAAKTNRARKNTCELNFVKTPP